MKTVETEVRRAGRPRSESARRIVLPTRVDETEAKLIERAVKLSTKDRAEWIRSVLVEAAKAA